MKKPAVNVFASDTLAGEIFRSDLEEDTYLFEYIPDCPESSAVSLTMPVTRDQYDSMGTLHPIFEMNLPEGVLRQKLELMFAKAVPDFDALSMLQVVGKSQIGRLRYAQYGAELEDMPTQSVQKLLSYDGAKDLFADLMTSFAKYSGISGMQPKVLIRDVAQDPLARLTHKNATHIVKSFDSREYPELAANEFFCMTASRYAGLPTASVQLSANRKMLVVDRFDVIKGEYLGFEDFCVLSGMRSGGRYDSSYEVLGKRIRQYVSPAHHPAAMSHYFGAVALACIIRNGDAHLKNFGVLYDSPDGEVRLAPVYDMLSTKPYQPRDVLALEMNGSKAYPTRRQLNQFGRVACSLSQNKIDTVIEQVLHGVTQTMVDMKTFVSEHPDFEIPMMHLCAAFREGISVATNNSLNGGSQ